MNPSPNDPRHGSELAPGARTSEPATSPPPPPPTTDPHVTPNRSTTPRGFAIYDDFVDSYGSRVRVIQSSNAEIDAVWMFSDSHAHLNVDQARRVRDALDAFITETGGES